MSHISVTDQVRVIAWNEVGYVYILNKAYTAPCPEDDFSGNFIHKWDIFDIDIVRLDKA